MLNLAATNSKKFDKIIWIILKQLEISRWNFGTRESNEIYIYIYIYMYSKLSNRTWRGAHGVAAVTVVRKWTWQTEFKSWLRLFTFYIVPIALGKAWIQLYTLQVISSADQVFF